MAEEGMLSPYRVLDLTEGGCMIGGKILGDMGADVIKIERPGGSPSRNIGPFYKDIPDPEKSLFWFAYNTNKRSITLNIETADGKEVFKRLVKTCDIMLESFPPGYLESLGLGYSALCETKPDIILTSITPFGQTGPKAHYIGSELTAWASGGCLYCMGDPDRAPTWISFPQAYLHAGAEAAAGSLVAFQHRAMTGEGQQVDVSIQQCVVWCLMNTTGHWLCYHWDTPRHGLDFKYHTGMCRHGARGSPCKDGYVCVIAFPVPVVPIARTFESLKEWMVEEGKAPEWWSQEQWYAKFIEVEKDEEAYDRFWKPIADFLKTKTKAELYQRALDRRLLISPTQNVKEMCEDVQLKVRNFWASVKHPELDDTLTYVGAPIKLSEAQWRIKRRPPLIGEHNEEIYQELGFSQEELILLKQIGAI